MSDNPVVTVLMPVYNSGEFLGTAVESILRQRFRNFEFIIIDDGSTCEVTRRLLSGINDDRARVIREPVNRGYIRALNKGLSMARGRYIARMDSDDVAASARLDLQVRFLDRHADVGVLGSACAIIDGDGRRKGVWRMPVQDLCVRWKGLVTNPFVHSTVMIRRDVLGGAHFLYNESLWGAEDYDLWTRLLTVTRGANLEQVLMEYRIHSSSVTSQGRVLQLTAHEAIASRFLDVLLPERDMDHDKIRDLRMFLAERAGQSEYNSGIISELAFCYIDILKAFTAKYGDSAEIELVKQDAAWMLLRLFIPRCSAGGDRRAIFQRFSMIDEHCIRSLFVSACRSIVWRLSPGRWVLG